jgi:methenyltetrahydromethanopterin cyclohydrolase
VQSEDFFAMGSGPMRILRGHEPMLEALFGRRPGSVADAAPLAVGVLESDHLPTAGAVDEVARACGVEPSRLTLCVAPVTSLAGVVQVVARSVETAMHKLHEVGFSAESIRSGWGVAPLPPPATDTIAGIGRTNDAILYGGDVTLWCEVEQTEIDRLGPRVPSDSSVDHGKPFAEIFRAYDYDFYKVDPGLFSPARVDFVNLRSGHVRSFGRAAEDVLRRSLGGREQSGLGAGPS